MKNKYGLNTCEHEGKMVEIIHGDHKGLSGTIYGLNSNLEVIVNLEIPEGPFIAVIPFMSHLKLL